MPRDASKIKIKNVLVIAVLTVVMFFISASIYSFTFGKTTRVIINGKILNSNEYQVYYTTPVVKEFSDNFMENLKVGAASDFQNFYFEVHHNDLIKLRLDFGVKPGNIDIKSLTIEQTFKKLTLAPKDIKALFSNSSKDIENYEIKDNVLHVYSDKLDPFIYADNMGQVFKNTPYDAVKLFVIFIVSIVLAILINKGYNNLVKKKLSPKNWAFIAIFLLIISAPGIVNFIGVYPGENTEQRELAQKPVFKLNKATIAAYPKDYENYMNDNFGIKNSLVYLNNYINVKLLGVSPMDSVLLGKNGWLYYAKDGDINMVDDYRGITMFSDEQLKKIKDNLEEQKAWLKAKGIPFVLLFAPNKESIYPEYLPDNIKKVQEETRLNVLISYLKKNSDVDIIDMRNELINNKNQGLLYYVTDSHWSELGAFYGQKAIMDEVNKYIPEVKSKELSDFNLIKETSIEGGDLAKMLSLQDQYKEQDVHVVPKTPYKWHVATDYNYQLTQGMVTENDNKALPRLLMFRDSYTINMQPYLSDYFSTAVYQWNHSFDPKLVMDTKPDVVVHEVVERYISELLAENPESMKK
jgi:hypothetical protein